MAWVKFVRVVVSAFCGVAVLVAAGCANPLADLGSDTVESETAEPLRSSADQTDDPATNDTGSSDTGTSGDGTDGEAGDDSTASTETTLTPTPSTSDDDSDEPASEPVMLVVTYESGVTSRLWQVTESGETLLGPIADSSGLGVVLTDIAASPSGELYAMSFSDLYLLDASDPNSIVATLIGAHGIVGGNALTFTNDGELFAAGTDGLFEINPATGESSPIPNFGQFGSSGDLVAGAEGLLATANSVSDADQPATGGDLLIQLDLSTESTLVLNNDLPTDSYGLALIGSRLYGMRIAGSNADCVGELLDIDPVTGATEVVRCLPFLPGGATVTSGDSESIA